MICTCCKKDLHLKVLPSLKEVDEYKVPDMLVPRLQKVYKYSQEDATNLVKEAKRMLYLDAKTNKAISPSLKVDDAWHEMLMFTRFYHQFANFIGKYINHNPTPGPPDGGKLFIDTKKRYLEVFAEVPDSKYWGKIDEA